MSIVLNDINKQTLDTLFSEAPHALLISGKSGIGLYTIAKEYAALSRSIVITVLPEKNETVDLEKGTITVESIRRLYELTKTIEPKGRTVIIDYAERMGIPAQNAFLKLLEEPPKDTQFILLSHTPESLLPTIHSRSQHVELRPVSLQQSELLLDELKVTDQTKRTQLLFIAQGLPAELTRLAQDELLFKTRAAMVKDARDFITGSPYTRLLLAKKYKDNRSQALTLLEDALRQLEQTLARGGNESTITVIARLEKLHTRISEQGNIRLQLSSAVVL